MVKLKSVLQDMQRGTQFQKVAENLKWIEGELGNDCSNMIRGNSGVCSIRKTVSWWWKKGEKPSG